MGGLGARQMHVLPDPERRFEGLFELALEAADARDPRAWGVARVRSGRGGDVAELRAEAAQCARPFPGSASVARRRGGGVEPEDARSRRHLGLRRRRGATSLGGGALRTPIRRGAAAPLLGILLLATPAAGIEPTCVTRCEDKANAWAAKVAKASGRSAEDSQLRCARTLFVSCVTRCQETNTVVMDDYRVVDDSRVVVPAPPGNEPSQPEAPAPEQR